MIKAVVGSKNPVKIKAVKVVFEKMLGKTEVIGVKAFSGVKNQPMSLDESYCGALNRAKNVLRKTKNSPNNLSRLLN